MDRQLIDYLPGVLSGVAQMRAVLCYGEQPEVIALWDAVQSVTDSQFVQTAPLFALERYERLLNILPKGTDTPAERRFRVFSRFNEGIPYTIAALCQKLAALCGADGYTVVLHPAQYKLQVRLALSVQSNYAEVQTLLLRMVPANLAVDLSLLYNQHSKLSALTHTALGGYTHNQLRKEVFTIA